jgi:hypothetical protein
MANPAVSLESQPIVTAMFRDFREAEQAYRAAVALDYKASDINVLMSERTRQDYLASANANAPLARKAAEHAPESSKSADKLGGPAGGTMGTIAPALAAVGAALLIPGLGLAVAGPVAVALTAAGTLGVATGLIGALTNWGLPKERAEQYQTAVRDGAIVLGIASRSQQDADALLRQWQALGGEAIRH